MKLSLEHTDTLPRIYTRALLEMNDGDVIDLGEGRSIRCVDDYRRTFKYRHGPDDYDEIIPMAYDNSDGTWVCAQWSDRNNQYTCADLEREYDAVYAFARTIGGLWGVRSYNSVGVLIRSVLARRWQ